MVTHVVVKLPIGEVTFARCVAREFQGTIRVMAFGTTLVMRTFLPDEWCEVIVRDELGLLVEHLQNFPCA